MKLSLFFLCIFALQPPLVFQCARRAVHGNRLLQSTSVDLKRWKNGLVTAILQIKLSTMDIRIERFFFSKTFQLWVKKNPSSVITGNYFHNFHVKEDDT